uniref:NEDD8-activating enzyme E1 catalytic subunit n=1 Tax=Arcella intermedia TaxID=1963864 RepID=A0A6B2L4A0_9EUKA
MLTRGGPFTSGSFNENDDESRNFLFHSVKVLVIGAGGLGCELLKDLALVGFRDIEVIDMDTIDYSNLNRQFLFRTADVGASKSERASVFINKRVPGVKVTAHHGKIQDMSDDFYMKFHVIISGLDSISARRWMNEKIYQLASKKILPDGRESEEWDDNTRIPFIDGGTEGFLGNARFIFPHKTPCFDCVDLFPAQQHVYQMCTIVNTPRLPEHCIAWAKDKAWDDEAPFGRSPAGDPVRIDGDNPQHIQWCLNKALEHAARFHIPTERLNYKFAQGVLKNIIPAIAATNAIIAAVCANEAFKAVTESSRNLNNYIYYFGNTGVGTNTQCLEKKEDCAVCNMKGLTIKTKKEATLADFRQKLIEDPRFKGIHDPVLTRCDVKNNKTYLTQTGRWASRYAANLTKPMSELVEEGDIVSVVDTGYKTPLILKVYWEA